MMNAKRMMKGVVLGAAVAVAAPLMAKDYYVNLNPSSVPGYDETAELGSAVNPFPTLAAATAASSATSTDVIHIANGHYLLDATLAVNAKTTLLGESRDGVVIDGQGQVRCIKTPAPCYDTNFRNLTITNGFISAVTVGKDQPADVPNNYGAGIWMQDGLVSNCAIRCCFVRGDVEKARVGAAAISGKIDASYNTIVRDSIIENNVASNNYNNTANSSAHVNGAVYNVNVYDCQLNFNRAYLHRASGYNNLDGGAGRGGCWYGCTFTSNAVISISGSLIGRGGALGYPDAVSNCVFVGNWADGRGQAIALSESRSVKSCTFVGNNPVVTGAGGGAINITGNNSSVDAVVDGCWFEGHTAKGVYGGENGAVCIRTALDRSIIRNCVFYRNTCNTKNGIVEMVKAGTISNCFFEENTDEAKAVQTGCIGTGSNSGQGYTAENCVFRNNVKTSALCGIYGGSVFDVTVRNCLFTDNKFNDAVTLTLWDGKMKLQEFADADETNGFLANIANCTIANNWLSGKAATCQYTSGSKIYVNGYYDTFLRNCLIYGNYSDEAKTTFSSSQLADTATSWKNGTNMVVNCAIDSRMTGVDKLTTDPVAAEHGNHDNLAISDPLFTDAAHGDYTLARKSPCVDAGTNMTWCASAVALNGLTYDYDPKKAGVCVYVDLKRPVARTCGEAPDIGAFEYKPLNGLSVIVR